MYGKKYYAIMTRLMTDILSYKTSGLAHDDYYGPFLFSNPWKIVLIRYTPRTVSYANELTSVYIFVTHRGMALILPCRYSTYCTRNVVLLSVQL